MGVRQFNIFGKQVGSHYLAMLTLGVTFGGAALAMGGGDKKGAGPPIQAKTSDEEKFILDFIAKAEAENKATAKH